MMTSWRRFARPRRQAAAREKAHRSGQHTPRPRVAYSVRSVPRSRLAVYVLEVVADAFIGYPEALRDLLVLEPARRLRQHLPLAHREHPRGCVGRLLHVRQRRLGRTPRVFIEVGVEQSSHEGQAHLPITHQGPDVIHLACNVDVLDQPRPRPLRLPAMVGGDHRQRQPPQQCSGQAMV